MGLHPGRNTDGRTGRRLRRPGDCRRAFRLLQGAHAIAVVSKQEPDKIVTVRLGNAGGVIVSYYEWVQGLQEYYWSKDMVFTELQKRMRGMFNKVSHFALEKAVSLRMAALMFGINQVAQAKKLRGLYP